MSPALERLPPCSRYSVSSYASIAPDQAPSPVSSLSLSPFFLPLATLKASSRTMWNLIGWCTIDSPQGGIAKCPEPSLVTRLADKGRTWGIGPILFAQGMVQSPSGPCKEMLGFFFFFNFNWALSLSDLTNVFFFFFFFFKKCVWRLLLGSTFYFLKR